jgi:hypothetical protein
MISEDKCNGHILTSSGSSDMHFSRNVMVSSLTRSYALHGLAVTLKCLGLLLLSSDISSKRDVTVIPPCHGLFQLGSIPPCQM